MNLYFIYNFYVCHCHVLYIISLKTCHLDLRKVGLLETRLRYDWGGEEYCLGLVHQETFFL
jgi:hypothetical protein